MTMASNNGNKDDLLRPGTVVETTFGVGVVMETRQADSDNDASHKVVHVLLGRLPGHSIGSCTSAYLQPDAVRMVQSVDNYALLLLLLAS